MTYYNYLGQAMPESASPTSGVTGSSAGNETLTAPAGAGSVDGAGGGDSLVGGSGDTTFYIRANNDRVAENAGAGIDTEVSYVATALAPNVENLQVHGDFNHGVGNGLDNLITTDGRAWLDGGGGNDVLVGATNTTTTFQVKAGEGNDVIYNWQGADQLSLVGFSQFHTSADVRAAMTQVGADVKLDLGGGQSLLFRGVDKSTGFLDKQFLLQLDTSKLGAMTFSDDFNSLNLYDPSHKTGVWLTNFGGNLKDQWAYSIPSNGEAQIYTAPGFEGLGNQDLHLNPFSASGGTLSITAQQIPADERDAAFGHQWSSGMLNTLGTFEQKYGYFEIKAQLPNAVGSWPAFWMRPDPFQSGQEADVMESIGLQPGQNYIRADGAASYLYDNALKLDPSAWHTYGMLWTKDTTTFYLDGVAVLSGPTPASWTNPVGLILNMAMGGWGGEADPGQYPASMKVDYIHVYALADGSSQVVTGAPDAPVGTIVDEAQPASLPAAQALTFADSGQPLSSGRIVVLPHDPTASDLPAGRAFVIWEDSGQVRGAVSNNGQLDAYTVLMAGGASQFSGAGTFLTNGDVVVGYAGSDAGQPAAWALLFDPATHTLTTHELGPSTGGTAFTAMAGGGFAASWHTSSGVEGRTYESSAYDGKGWWAPATDLPGDVSGVTADGQLIAGGKVFQVALNGSSAVVGQVLNSSGGALDGGDGPDTIHGADGTTNEIRAFGGNDVVVGGTGRNVLNGNVGDDSVAGRSSVGDELSGGQGNDTINATQSTAHNSLNGNKGNDSVVGGNYGDTLHGGQADDVIVGGSGADWISGDLGHDTVTGGGGADIFRAFSGSGTMIVTDFHAAEGDRVLIDAGASYTVTQAGADTHIDVSGGGEVILQNINKDQLAAGWIFQA